MATVKLSDAALHEALANVLGHSMATVRRVVIDIQPGLPPVIHVERYDTGKVINIVKALDGMQIERVDRAEE